MWHTTPPPPGRPIARPTEACLTTTARFPYARASVHNDTAGLPSWINRSPFVGIVSGRYRGTWTASSRVQLMYRRSSCCRETAQVSLFVVRRRSGLPVSSFVHHAAGTNGLPGVVRGFEAGRGARVLRPQGGAPAGGIS